MTKYYTDSTCTTMTPSKGDFAYQVHLNACVAAVSAGFPYHDSAVAKEGESKFKTADSETAREVEHTEESLEIFSPEDYLVAALNLSGLSIYPLLKETGKVNQTPKKTHGIATGYKEKNGLDQSSALSQAAQQREENKEIESEESEHGDALITSHGSKRNINRGTIFTDDENAYGTYTYVPIDWNVQDDNFDDDWTLPGSADDDNKELSDMTQQFWKWKSDYMRVPTAMPSLIPGEWCCAVLRSALCCWSEMHFRCLLVRSFVLNCH